MSSEVKHTPGPWSWYIDDKDIRIEPFPIWVDYDDVDRDEAKANACLIAAAPEMLEELEKWSAWFKDTYDDYGCESILKVIAKAKGEPID